MPTTITNAPVFVSRQINWPDGEHVIEIASGGRDYSNPGMLTPQYDGEGHEYMDPREALVVAVMIARQWHKHQPNNEISIAAGFTSGMTLPMGDGTDSDVWKTDKAAPIDTLLADIQQRKAKWPTNEQWAAWGLGDLGARANKRAETLIRCDRCGEVISGESYQHAISEERAFCSTYCAETDYEEHFEDEDHTCPQQ